MSMTRMMSLLPLLMVMTACAPPLEGDWVGAESVEGEDNEMELTADRTGEATIWAVVGYEGEYFLVKSEFDVAWTESGDTFDLDMECSSTDFGGDCGDYDFVMECELRGDDDELDCEGDELWSDYDNLKWERR